ncbi:YveK family protein [Ectobacillus ponti]|uniref:Wzz/FepE/Etk N-terminal domain-containing protein n=1 Tax=Ectobacillus ponti TaxID=2961894 RepID=A0AA41X9H3_9BACI|nr:Wzz/FepE/Etk N-terminal domain-containing protein [Ectobacillus ponti]MCP8967846.1 Wzz/FepE/Etk N-terminal domain-containing protein [Ectobacillus ponti]
MEETISLKELFQVLRKRWLMIVGITGIAAIASAIISFYFMTPVYQASTQILVNPKQASDTALVKSDDVRLSLQLINTYKGVLTSPVILDEVAKGLELNMKGTQLAKNVSVASEQESQILTVNVMNTSPKLAEQIANKLAEVFQTQISSIMKIDNVTILAKAEPAAELSPVKPRPLLNVAIAMVVGLMSSIGLSFLIEYMDNSIKKEQELETVLGIPLLGAVAQMTETKEKAAPAAVQVGGKAVGS